MPNFTPEVKRNQWLALIISVFLFLSLSSGAFLWIFNQRVYPGVYIDDIPVGGLTKDETNQLLSQKTTPLPEHLTLTAVGISIASSAAELGVVRNIPQVVDQAYVVGRTGSLGKRLLETIKAWAVPHRLSTQLDADQNKLTAFITELKRQVDIPGTEPRVSLRTTNSPHSLEIRAGTVGREVDLETTRQLLLQSINKNVSTIPATVVQVGAELSAEEIATTLERAKNLVGKRIILRGPSLRIEVSDQELVSLVQPPERINTNRAAELVTIWEKSVNRVATDAVFSYDPQTLVVSQFTPHREGIEIDRITTISLITNQTAQLLTAPNQPRSLNEYQDTELDLPVVTTQPAIALGDTNDLGIREVIGLGESEYDHSIPNRIHNVALTSFKINNYLIPPGTEFSFNKALGEVSAATGFKSAYVIKNGKTELGDGGGVCQVSTTVFRAALNAGLNITRRLPHSYRVSYYELNAKPGIDATVYAGEVDLRFINDTNHHILLHTQTDSDNLYMKVELYGTSDGRTAEIIDHKVWDFRAPPPPQYYPDPSLAAGQKRQIDWAVGGVKAEFTYVARDKNGAEIHRQTYFSNYKPWSAKYLVGM